MIDILLMNNLVKDLSESMRLILVGDIDHLPSIAVGNVLRDIIEFERVPVVQLTLIFRQAHSSRIVMRVNAINAGKLPT